MSIELTNDLGGYANYNDHGWRAALGLALAYGWKPAGTEAPEQKGWGEWNGEYTSNSGQRITPADAAQLADALDLALLDPEIPMCKNGVEPFPGAELLTASFYRSALKEIIELCRYGPIRID